MNVNGVIISQDVVKFEQFLDKNLAKTCLFKNDEFVHGYDDEWLLTSSTNKLEINKII